MSNPSDCGLNPGEARTGIGHVPVAARRRALERGDPDLILLKRAASEKGGIAVWPECIPLAYQ